MRASTGLQRRRLLQGAAAMATLDCAARAAAADAALPGLAEALAALGPAPAPSALITLEAPALAENGALVPITVASALPGTRQITLLVDTNPQPLALQVTLPAGTEPFVATRIRMAASGSVLAVVHTADGVFAASRAIEVAVGGCG